MIRSLSLYGIIRLQLSVFFNQDVVLSSCDPKSGNDNVLSCLLTLAARGDDRRMTRECRTTLMEIEYFMARDFAINPKLYK